jgi:hypothetical protein
MGNVYEVKFKNNSLHTSRGPVSGEVFIYLWQFKSTRNNYEAHLSWRLETRVGAVLEKCGFHIVIEIKLLTYEESLFTDHGRWCGKPFLAVEQEGDPEAVP